MTDVEPTSTQVVTDRRVNAASAKGPLLTVELAIYAMLILVALTVRLAALGRWPLLEEEIVTALAAWQRLQGHAPLAEGYVPLVLNMQLTFFWLSVGPTSARLASALVGGLAVGLPYLYRATLGRIAALTVAAVMALSPGWVYASRTADGAILAVVLGLVAIGAWLRYVRTGKRQPVLLGAVALAAALAAGPNAHTLWTAAALLLFVGVRSGVLAEWFALLASRLRDSSAGSIVAVFGVALVAVSTAMWVNPGGMGAMVAMAVEWGASLLPGRTELPWYYAIRALAIYEPFTLALAIVGVVYGVLRGNMLSKGLALWLAYALILATLGGQRGPRWFLDAVLPLTVLAGLGMETLYKEWYRHGTWNDMAAYVASLCVFGFVYLGFVSYLLTVQSTFLTLAAVGMGILVLGLVGYGVWFDGGSARRAAGLLVGAVFLTLFLRGTAALAYDRARDPWEPLLHRPASVSLNTFEPFIEGLSLRMAGDPRLIDILYEQDLEPWMSWLLREYPHAASTVTVGPRSEATVLITRPRAEQEWPPGYVGQSFALREHPDAEMRMWREWWQWLLFRPPGPPAERELFWVWVRTG